MLFRTFAVSSFVFAVSAPVLALTPEEAWEGWQKMATAAGQTITSASATRSGDTLTVTGSRCRRWCPTGR